MDDTTGMFDLDQASGGMLGRQSMALCNAPIQQVPDDVHDISYFEGVPISATSYETIQTNEVSDKAGERYNLTAKLDESSGEKEGTQEVLVEGSLLLESADEMTPMQQMPMINVFDNTTRVYQSAAGYGDEDQLTSESGNISAVKVTTHDDSKEHGMLDGWEVLYDDDTSQPYYYHSKSGTTSWHCPGTESIDISRSDQTTDASKMEVTKANAPENMVSSEALIPKAEALHTQPTGPESDTLGTHWQKAFDLNTGCHYYFNVTTRQSVWELPEGAVNAEAVKGAEAAGKVAFPVSEETLRPKKDEVVIGGHIFTGLGGTLAYPMPSYELDYD